MGALDKLRLQSSVDDIKTFKFWLAVLAEVIGTFILVFLGSASTTYVGSRATVAFGFGLGVVIAVWIFANTSGGHINPAITIAMLFSRRISLVRCLLYIPAQMFGAFLGSAILAACINPKAPIAVTHPNSVVGYAGAFFLEAMITGVLVFTVFATCDVNRKDLRGSGPLAIGLSVTLCHLGFIPVTGSSMNPARSFGPSAFYSAIWKKFDKQYLVNVAYPMEGQWVYWIGPIVGGLIASIIYERILQEDCSMRRSKSWLCDEIYEESVMSGEEYIPLKEGLDEYDD